MSCSVMPFSCMALEKWPALSRPVLMYLYNERSETTLLSRLVVFRSCVRNLWGSAGGEAERRFLLASPRAAVLSSFCVLRLHVHLVDDFDGLYKKDSLLVVCKPPDCMVLI